MAKTEDIEAKLAAYVDGEIDQAARAEIEKHLATNPQHRNLIKELIQQRDLVRGLPRETAPLEVAESVNAQLERAVLLGDVDGDITAATMQAHRWPQFRAIAAILIFTVSLACVIYYLLPSPNQKPELAADLRLIPSTSPTGDSAPAPGSHSTNGLIGLSSVATSATASKEPFAAPTTMPVALAAQPEPRATTDQQLRIALALRDDAMGGRGGTAITDPIRRAAERPLVSNSLSPTVEMFQSVIEQRSAAPTAALPLGQTTQVLWIVEAADPQATSREMTRYLSSANFTWEANGEPGSTPTSTPSRQLAMGSRLQSQSVYLKSGPSSNPSQSSTDDQREPVNAIPPAGGNPATAPIEETPITAQSAQVQATQPSVIASANTGDSAADRQTASQNPVPFGRQIYVKQVSRTQAAQIRLALDQIRTRPAAEAGTALTMSPTIPVTSVGLNGFQPSEKFVEDRLRELSYGLPAAPSTTPSLVDVVNGPATIPAPSTAPIASTEMPTNGSASRTVPTLAAAAPQFDPKGVNFSLAPSTAPAVEFKSPTTTESDNASAPADAPVLTIAPATQPAGEVFDVVILIQPQIAIVPTTGPSTNQTP